MGRATHLARGSSVWKSSLRRGLAAAGAGAVLMGVIMSVAPSRHVAFASSGDPGGAGVNPQLPATPSEVTVHGHGAFSNLTVNINQTKDLINQAISVSWSGCTAGGNTPTACGPTFSSGGHSPG